MGPSYPTPLAGLCADCRHALTIRSQKASTFVMCGRARTDAGYPKYPVLPVLACPGYDPAWLPDDRAGRQADPESGTT